MQNQGFKNIINALIFSVIYSLLCVFILFTFAGCHKTPTKAQIDLTQSDIVDSAKSAESATQKDSTKKDSRRKDSSPSKIDSKTKQESKKCNAPSPKTSALLSFVGDNVLGDYKGASGDTFNAKFREINGDFAYFSNGVREVLGSDDLTIGNMEGVLSDRELKNAFEKPFSFKGQSSYTQVLREASIEALNLANNHSRDYGAQGFADTKEHLLNAGFYTFGEGILSIAEVNGIKFGLAGHRGWNLGIKSQVAKEIAELKSMGADFVIFTFHWGEEREHYPNATQKQLGRFSIDNGADMVVAHHPHVLQGIEHYKDKKIVYSLGNFIYGGAKNPNDKDTMIFQSLILAFSSEEEASEFATSFEYHECLQKQWLARFSQGEFIKSQPRIGKSRHFVLLHNIVPASISSSTTHNDYAPKIYKKNAPQTAKTNNGTAQSNNGYERIFNRLEQYSRDLR
ncbi:CapA family protein [Helicobacter sp. T3_23-1056]